MCFDHEAGHLEVQGFLGGWEDEIDVTADVAGIIQHGHFGIHAHELDGDLPHGGVAVRAAVEKGKSAVDSNEFSDP